MLVAPEHVRRVAADDVWYPGARDEVTDVLDELWRANDHLQRDEHDQFVDGRLEPGEEPIPLQEKEAVLPPAEAEGEDQAQNLELEDRPLLRNDFMKDLAAPLVEMSFFTDEVNLKERIAEAMVPPYDMKDLFADDVILQELIAVILAPLYVHDEIKCLKYYHHVQLNLSHQIVVVK